MYGHVEHGVGRCDMYGIRYSTGETIAFSSFEEVLDRLRTNLLMEILTGVKLRSWPIDVINLDKYDCDCVGDPARYVESKGLTEDEEDAVMELL
jgi:hypothetical protein